MGRLFQSVPQLGRYSLPSNIHRNFVTIVSLRKDYLPAKQRFEIFSTLGNGLIFSTDCRVGARSVTSLLVLFFDFDDNISILSLLLQEHLTSHTVPLP